MVNDPLTFACPACGVKLTVPSSMAGITGPCPTCSSIIQAPIRSVSAIPAHPTAAAAPIAPPAPAEVYPSQPAPAPGLATSPNEQPQPSPSSIPPAQAQQLEVVEISSPAVIRPEPRGHKPRFGSHHEVVARPMPGPEEYVPANLPPTSHRRSKRPLHALIFLLVVASFAGVFFGFTTLLNDSPFAPKVQQRKTAAPATVPKPIPIPETKGTDAPPPAATEAPKPQAATPPAKGTPSPTNSAPSPSTPGVAALQVLEKFLTASTLAERLPLMETSTPMAELEASVLARPFPPAPRYSPDVQETDFSGNFTDIFYNVDFEGADGKINPQIILVRVRPNQSPKVIADPFLDSFGGRLAAYAATPNPKPGSFQIIVSAVARTTDNSIPNHEEKLRLKLLPRDNEREITNAYFSKLSKISEMLLDDSSSLRYGQARTCKVSMSWNTTEDPQKPFLEAIGITDFQWGP